MYTSRVPSPRRAALSFRTRERFRTPEGPAALVQVRLETGRTHQIRVQLQDVGLPVLADPTYGPQAARAHPAAARLGRLALHAWRLALPHPATGAPLAAEAPPPADFEAALALLRGA
jgi:23S rRNA pseudouridine1911/1915/1917 synthase